jgi:hypothetical protein
MIMGHQAAPRGTANERPQRGESGDLGIFLKITKRGGALRPAIEAQYGALPLGDGRKQTFIHRHIAGGLSLAGIK